MHLPDLARHYVELSNAARLDNALAMFAEDARYESSQVGSFDGRAAIESMMRDFFARFDAPHWLVTDYRLVDDDTVEFDFTMTAADVDGNRIERRGVERITFLDTGSIWRVSVHVAD